MIEPTTETPPANAHETNSSRSLIERINSDEFPRIYIDYTNTSPKSLPDSITGDQSLDAFLHVLDDYRTLPQINYYTSQGDPLTLPPQALRQEIHQIEAELITHFSDTEQDDVLTILQENRLGKNAITKVILALQLLGQKVPAFQSLAQESTTHLDNYVGKSQKEKMTVTQFCLQAADFAVEHYQNKTG